MVVLVGYASAHGSTREIAEHIGVRLREQGLAHHVRDLERATLEEPERYEALVLGSAVHDRAWLPPAKDFLRHHGELLETRPVWLFSVGMPGALRGPWKRLAAREGPLILADLPGPPPYRSHRLL
jgi:menaquinone-dependent protoporphyrinogen oxidase